MMSLDILRDKSHCLPNILIVGSDDATDRALEQVSSLFGGPAQTCVLPGPLDLPGEGYAALILHNLDALFPQQQMELSDWLESGQRVPVVSLNPSSIFALVADGRFDERLYYRLNMILEETDAR